MQKNPRLEALRSSVPSPPDITPMYKRWLENGESVLWTRCLGYRPGWRANRAICRLIDATNPGHGDWKDLASEVGLQYIDMKRIENTFGREGPTCRVLEEFSNSEYPTVGELVKALRRLGRDDVLLAVSPYLDEFFQLHASGYPPLPIELEDMNDDNQSDSGVSSVRSVAIFCAGGPDSHPVESVPLPNSEICTNGHCSGRMENRSEMFEEELKKFEEISKVKSDDNMKVALLTFASDGAEEARAVARMFRQKRENLPRLGVLTLGDNEDFLSVDPWGVIMRWFEEVDYIVPIITPEYLERISMRFTRSVDEDGCLDARYARLIYTLMCNEFTQRGCLNYRVRPLLSKEVRDLLNDSGMLRNPLFMAWKKVEDCDKMAEALLKSPLKAPVL